MSFSCSYSPSATRKSSSPCCRRLRVLALDRALWTSTLALAPQQGCTRLCGLRLRDAVAVIAAARAVFGSAANSRLRIGVDIYTRARFGIRAEFDGALAAGLIPNMQEMGLWSEAVSLYGSGFNTSGEFYRALECYAGPTLRTLACGHPNGDFHPQLRPGRFPNLTHLVLDIWWMDMTTLETLLFDTKLETLHLFEMDFEPDFVPHRGASAYEEARSTLRELYIRDPFDFTILLFNSPGRFPFLRHLELTKAPIWDFMSLAAACPALEILGVRGLINEIHVEHATLKHLRVYDCREANVLANPMLATTCVLPSLTTIEIVFNSDRMTLEGEVPIPTLDWTVRYFDQYPQLTRVMASGFRASHAQTIFADFAMPLDAPVMRPRDVRRYSFRPAEGAHKALYLGMCDRRLDRSRVDVIDYILATSRRALRYDKSDTDLASVFHRELLD